MTLKQMIALMKEEKRLLEAQLAGVDADIGRFKDALAALTAPSVSPTNGSKPKESKPKPKAKKNRLSPAGRRAIVVAAKSRGARQRAAQAKSNGDKPKPQKRSAAARKRMAAAQRKRWAAYRAAQA